MQKTCLLAAVCFLLGPRPGGAAETTLRFEVTVAPGLLTAPQDGRLLVVLGRGDQTEPRFTIGNTGLRTPPVLGRDVTAFQPGVVAALDRTAVIFPIESLDRLPAGEYQVQAVLHTNRDLNFPNAPGSLYSTPQKVALDPARGGTVKLELTRQVPPEQLPSDTATVKFLKLPSELLSKFHGRPMYLRAAVILPPDFEREPERRYPLHVLIGGYGTRFTAAGRIGQGNRADGPRMLTLLLDGAGPYGDPYQVNSANNGPYGDAITQELIPHVEKTYRGIGRPHARVLSGASTGGWVSLALQIFYPDFFNGAWSHAPDPVDFRAYELINIYQDENAYVNRHGFERPAMRERSGETIYTLRHETQIENVLGRGDSWTTSGKDWCAWNATFGPRGEDGRPKALWDPKTGKIDRSVVEHWKKYDLRLVLQQNWPTLGPKLRGKLRIWVGEADDYFLNNAVHLLDAFLRKANPPYEGKITYGPGGGHGWQGISRRQMLDEMAAAVAREQP
jgi:S-formylglutathione hydrolase FrmB